MTPIREIPPNVIRSIPPPVIRTITPPVTQVAPPPVTRGIKPPVINVPGVEITYPTIDVPTQEEWRGIAGGDSQQITPDAPTRDLPTPVGAQIIIFLYPDCNFDSISLIIFD